ncbi:MAG: WbqC family protein, partial [Bacteroidales bacterium]|nr:WbqC family protein [Bacteroidales bacterium]
RLLKAKIEVYDQRRSNFEHSLSIIDVMMFNTPEKIADMLDNIEVEFLN